MYYLDTSFLVPIFVAEPDSSAILSWYGRVGAAPLLTAEWTIPEFASVLARRVRMKLLNGAAAESAFRLFEQWLGAVRLLAPTRAEFDAAARFVRTIPGLRAPDALHLAVQSAHGKPALMTLDSGMAKAAVKLGLQIGRY